MLKKFLETPILGIIFGVVISVVLIAQDFIIGMPVSTVTKVLYACLGGASGALLGEVLSSMFYKQFSYKNAIISAVIAIVLSLLLALFV